MFTAQIAKNLTLILTTFISITRSSIKIKPVIVSNFKICTFNIKVFTLVNQVLYIYYLLYFQRNKDDVETLINSNNKINIITLAYTKKLGFWI